MRFSAVAAMFPLLLGLAVARAEAPRYNTFCEIGDGFARGYFQPLEPSSMSFSGKLYFTVYDEDGARSWPERRSGTSNRSSRGISRQLLHHRYL